MGINHVTFKEKFNIVGSKNGYSNSSKIIIKVDAMPNNVKLWNIVLRLCDFVVDGNIKFRDHSFPNAKYYYDNQGIILGFFKEFKEFKVFFESPRC